MRITVKKKIEHEVYSLIPDIAYASVPSWYGSTRRNLKMDILAPKVREGHEKCPLAVWFCGGEFRLMDKSVWIPEMMYFARKGYVVASVEYRTSNEVNFPEPLCDAKAAIRYLKAHAEEYCIDPDRICVMGESAGGSIASLVGMTGGIREYERGDYLEYDSKVQAVIDFYGLVDMDLEVSGEPNDMIPPWTVQDYLGVLHTKQDIRKASALSYVTEAVPPVMILHGGADQAVSPMQSEKFYEKLQEKGVLSDLYLIEDAAHGDDAFYQDEVLAKVDEFLKKSICTEKTSRREQ